MTDQEIEQVLRKAPRVKTPSGLLDKLQADITLPRRKESATVNRADAPSLLHRWLPAVSFAAVLLSCIVAIGVQTNQIVGLKRENQTLRAATQNLAQLRIKNAEYQKLAAAHQELEGLRKDAAELRQLRAEIAQLRAQQQEMEKLRAENQQLLAAGRQPVQPATDDDFFARTEEDLKAQAQSIACVNNLKQVGLAARIWASNNGDVFPPNFLTMSNELSTPKILFCPADKGHSAARNWAGFGSANIVSYEFLNPSGSETNPYVLLTRCPIHGHVGLSDGSVWQGNGLGRIFTITLKDGKQVFTPVKAGPFE